MSGNGTLPACTCRRPSSAQRCSCGKTLPGLSSPLASKAHFTRCCWLRSISENIIGHQVALLDADAMLAGENAPDLDAELENFGAELFGLLQLTRDIGIIENERMQIAIAGMKHVGDAQPIFRGHLSSCA